MITQVETEMDDSNWNAILKNMAILGGILVATLLIILGVLDHREVLEEAKTPQHHAAAALFVVILAIYFATFMVIAIILCIEGFKLMFTPHRIAPIDNNDPPPCMLQP